MGDYLTLSDIPILREYQFTPGYSGESWFGIDKNDESWQVYAVENDSRLTFVNANDRASVYLTRERFEELFG